MLMNNLTTLEEAFKNFIPNELENYENGVNNYYEKSKELFEDDKVGMEMIQEDKKTMLQTIGLLYEGENEKAMEKAKKLDTLPREILIEIICN